MSAYTRNTPDKLRQLLFETKIAKQPSGCWEWQGSRYNTGYGEIWVDGKRRLAHRVAYQLVHGPVGRTVVILHRCDNPACVNPDHLISGTQRANMADMRAKGRASRMAKAIGERNGNAILTVVTVREIREKYAGGGYTMKQLGAQYGTDWTNISCIVNRRTWKDVEPD